MSKWQFPEITRRIHCISVLSTILHDDQKFVNHKLIESVSSMCRHRYHRHSIIQRPYHEWYRHHHHPLAMHHNNGMSVPICYKPSEMIRSSKRAAGNSRMWCPAVSWLPKWVEWPDRTGWTGLDHGGANSRQSLTLLFTLHWPANEPVVKNMLR